MTRIFLFVAAASFIFSTTLAEASKGTRGPSKAKRKPAATGAAPKAGSGHKKGNAPSQLQSVLNARVKPTQAPAETHVKARTESPPGYDRRHVPADKTSWSVPFKNYRPKDKTDPDVIKNDRTKRKDGWADPVNVRKVGRTLKSFVGKVRFGKDRRPRNPRGRTGMRGRGLLGKWGANFAADTIIFRNHPETGELQMLAIKRTNGQWAIPGGMVDDGESAISAGVRELAEETGVKLNMSRAKILYRGYVDDPRNTDNAWMESTVAMKVLTKAQAKKLKPRVVDPKEVKAVRWMTLSPRNVKNLYASHGEFVKQAMDSLKPQKKSSNAAPQKQSSRAVSTVERAARLGSQSGSSN